MIIDRLKNVLKANISAQMDKLKDNEYDLWRTFFDEDEHDASFYTEDNFQDTTEEWEQTNHNYSNTHTNQIQKEAEYYSDLELKPGASFKEIKSAYRRLVKMYHPDLFQNAPEKKKIADEVTRKINEAYNYFEKKFESK